MNKSQLIRDLKHRLSSLLEDSMFAKARQDRAAQRVGSLEDAIIAHNIAVSEEILQLDASSVNGVVNDGKIENFRKHINDYLEKNGTGNEEYDHYISIISEYLALVARQPLHPLKVRHQENHPPEDSGHRKYCSWRACYSKDKHSLCRYCNCLPWPEATRKFYN
jgi:uncharacterized protein (UPF0305 family)